MSQRSSTQQHFKAVKRLKLTKQKTVKEWAKKNTQNKTDHSVEDILSRYETSVSIAECNISLRVQEIAILNEVPVSYLFYITTGRENKS